MPDFNLPKLESMESLPPNSNPYHYDQFNMGCNVSGAWVAMFSKHAGLKQEHNMSDEEKTRRENGELIFYDDPKYIIMVNQKTGQRFKLVFPDN